MNDGVILLRKIEHMRDKGVSDRVGVVAVQEIPRFAVFLEPLPPDDPVSEDQSGVEKGDRRRNDAIPEKVREAFDGRAVTVAVAPVDPLGRDLRR